MSADETRSPEPLDAETLAEWRRDAIVHPVLAGLADYDPAPRILALLDALRDRDAEIERLRGEHHPDCRGAVALAREDRRAAEAALAAVTRERDALMAGDHPAVGEAKSLAAIIEHHGWCQYGGMTTESCARSVCDCGYEGIVPERDRLRTELASERAAHAALRVRVAALADEWERNYASMLIGGFSGCSISADAGAKRLRDLLADTEPAGPGAQTKDGCGTCMTCDPPSGGFSRFYVCATCGNKRCPAATDCQKWECSGSNDPKQAPVRKTEVEKETTDE